MKIITLNMANEYSLRNLKCLANDFSTHKIMDIILRH